MRGTCDWLVLHSSSAVVRGVVTMFVTASLCALVDAVGLQSCGEAEQSRWHASIQLSPAAAVTLSGPVARGVCHRPPVLRGARFWWPRCEVSAHSHHDQHQTVVQLKRSSVPRNHTVVGLPQGVVLAQSSSAGGLRASGAASALQQQ